MLHAEILKLTTITSTRTAVIIAALGLVITQLSFTLMLPALRESGSAGPEITGDLPAIDLGLARHQLDAVNPLGASMGAGSIGVVLLAVLVLGVLAGTADFRFGGITGTALAEPRRGRIVLAKSAGTAVVGATTAAILAAVAAATLLITLLVTGTAVTAAAPELLGILGRSVLALTCLTLLGLAAGLILRNQLLAVLVSLGVVVLEPALQSIVQLATGTLPPWTQLLPISLVQAAVGGEGMLGAGPALGALAVLTAALLGVAALTLRHRDL